MKNILFIAFSSFIFLFVSCTSEQETETYIPIDEIIPLDTHLIPNKDTKIVSTTLNFKDIDAIDYLLVRKSVGDSYSAKISQSELTSDYIFNYTIQKTDPQNFRLVLAAFYKDGNMSKELSLNVDNRWGFFIRNVTRIARVTGSIINGENFPSPNNTATKWNVGGTDLGIIWEMQPGKYGIFFGDTFGYDFKPNPANPGPNGGSWRSNVLAFSEDNDLEDGLSFSNMATDDKGYAREIVYGGKDSSGNGDWTSIPTAAIRANGIDYVHYFNMRNWTGWITNYSGIYKSVDNGLTWAKCKDITFSSYSFFGQVGYFKKDGYVYMIGTQTGRDSNAKLARFHETDIENKTAYEYWNASTNQWIKGNENEATVLIEDKVGELSFIYNETHKKWIIAYFNADRYNITMRTAEDITGPWSEPYELANGREYAQLYGSYIHPLSVTGDNLYFTMSMWMPYNVFLMKAELADMGEFNYIDKYNIMNTRTLIITFVWMIMSNIGICAQEHWDAQERIELNKGVFPKNFSKAIDAIQYDLLGIERGKSHVKVIDNNTLYINLSFSLKNSVQQGDWRIAVKPDFLPSFHWAPHLTPTDRNVIDQHVFRSPALIVADDHQTLILIPDLDIMQKGTPVRWYMDMDASSNTLILGMCNNHVSEHVLFERDQETTYPKGDIEIGFYLMYSDSKEVLRNPFKKPLEFMWSRWGHAAYVKGNPVKENLETYVKHTYNWAFNSWSENVWQQFELDGKKVGAPVFIVNVTQSPNYPGEINEREFRSIWNQAWFSSLRSASGLYRYARRTGNRELLAKANLTKELALSFPQRNGFFYGLIGTEMHEVEIDGKKYNRSKGWNTYYWGNSNRNPYTWNPKESPYHILDMSWTALLMLRWYDELEKDARLLAYAEDYAMALLGIQYENGFFPGWLDLKTMQPMNHLNASPETSLSVTFLLKLYELTHKEEYKRAAFKAMNAVIHEIIPVGKWEDFETYWSCSRYGSDNLVGKKVLRNNMHKQNNFSMFWTAEALLECYRLTSNKEYLDYGQRTLDELLMTQASWQPPYMYVNVLGGFGVLNADGEWNDSRESLFSELIIQYGKLLGKPEYIERGYAALKASFVMMYCTENPQTKQQWEKVHSFFASEDYGFMMENYGHGGRTNPAGEGMGEFTIYDWGNGAAAEAYNRILDKFGKIE